MQCAAVGGAGLDVQARRVPVERYFTTHLNMKCRSAFHQNHTMVAAPMTSSNAITAAQVSFRDCAARCLSMPQCQAFTQYDTNNDIKV